MESFRNILLGCILCAFTTSSFGQMLETRQLISVAAGYGTLKGGKNHIFFPSPLNQSGLNVDFSYEHKINSWWAAGLSLGYNHFTKPSGVHKLTEISTHGSEFLTVGPRVVFHSPHLPIGVFHRMRVGLALTPQFQYYSGERSLLINNEAIPDNENVFIHPTLEMNPKSSGFGAKLSPEMNYRISQRLGLKLTYNLQILNVNTGYNREQLTANSILGGLIFTFGNRKLLF